MLTLFPVVPICHVVAITAPVTALHFIISSLLNSLHRWLFDNLLWHITRMLMHLLIWRVDNHLSSCVLLILTHLNWVAIDQSQTDNLINNVIYCIGEPIHLWFTEYEESVLVISLTFETDASHVDFEFSKNLWFLIVANDSRIRESGLNLVTQIIERSHVFIFWVSAIREMVEAIAASVDVYFELALVPIGWQLNRPNHLLFLFIIFVFSIVFQVWSFILILFLYDRRLIIPVLHTIKRIDFYIFELRASQS